MATNIVGVKWYRMTAANGTVGVILVRTMYKGYRAYIGTGLDVNDDYDAEFIVMNGTLLPRAVATPLFPNELKQGTMYNGRLDRRQKSRSNNKEKQPDVL